MPVVKAVCVSEKTGQTKVPVASIELKVDYGIAGDAHAGSSRQVSLLDFASMERMKEKLATIGPGSFAENIAVEGLNALKLAVGDSIRVGENVVLQITQIGKTCHHGCEIRQIVGDCIMPKEGLFAKVQNGGTVRPGDTLARVAG